MKILLVSATVFEIAKILEHLEQNFKKASFSDFQNEKHTIYTVVSGVGAVNAALGLARHQKIKEVDMVLSVGIAGSYSKEIKPGTVVEVVKDRYADLGIEEADGKFIDAFELELIDKYHYPFIDGWVNNEKPKLETKYPKVSGLTVNKVSGSTETIEKLKSKYSADIESMESAAIMHVCKLADVKFNQIRAISNFVEPRNKDHWELDLAIENLNQACIELLHK